MSSVHTIAVKNPKGEDTNLGAHKGKVLLVVNTASKCGLTPQYTALESTYQKYKDRGLTVVGFPANNFLQQEPGTDEEIANFCSTNYNVTFPLYQKISVKGENQHPLYKYLTETYPNRSISSDVLFNKLKGHGIPVEDNNQVLWNFEKFIVNKNGETVARISPDISPDDARVVSVIESELAK